MYNSETISASQSHTSEVTIIMFAFILLGIPKQILTYRNSNNVQYSETCFFSCNNIFLHINAHRPSHSVTTAKPCFYLTTHFFKEMTCGFRGACRGACRSL